MFWTIAFSFWPIRKLEASLRLKSHHGCNYVVCLEFRYEFYDWSELSFASTSYHVQKIERVLITL